MFRTWVANRDPSLVNITENVDPVRHRLESAE